MFQQFTQAFIKNPKTHCIGWACFGLEWFKSSSLSHSALLCAGLLSLFFAGCYLFMREKKPLSIPVKTPRVSAQYRTRRSVNGVRH